MNAYRNELKEMKRLLSIMSVSKKIKNYLPPNDLKNLKDSIEHSLLQDEITQKNHDAIEALWISFTNKAITSVATMKHIKPEEAYKFFWDEILGPEIP